MLISFGYLFLFILIQSRIFYLFSFVKFMYDLSIYELYLIIEYYEDIYRFIYHYFELLNEIFLINFAAFKYYLYF